MTVATFDLPFGLDYGIDHTRDAYSTSRAEGFVQRRRCNRRVARTIPLRRADGTEGDRFRIWQLWALTHGVLDMDFTHPETAEAMRVVFAEEPKVRLNGARRYEISCVLEEAL